MCKSEILYAQFHNICRFQESASNSTQVQVQNGKFFICFVSNKLFYFIHFDNHNLFNSFLSYWRMNLLMNVNLIIKHFIMFIILIIQEILGNTHVWNLKLKGYCWTGLNSSCKTARHSFFYFTPVNFSFCLRQCYLYSMKCIDWFISNTLQIKWTPSGGRLFI